MQSNLQLLCYGCITYIPSWIIIIHQVYVYKILNKRKMQYSGLVLVLDYWSTCSPINIFMVITHILIPVRYSEEPNYIIYLGHRKNFFLVILTKYLYYTIVSDCQYHHSANMHVNRFLHVSVNAMWYRHLYCGTLFNFRWHATLNFQGQQT